uniref:Uncharacterized protein n=1 Tax=Sinocyclocheilus anshuiensis TaxID=1608454 RepID=A0A671RZ30_9TELE
MNLFKHRVEAGLNLRLDLLIVLWIKSLSLIVKFLVIVLYRLNHCGVTDEGCAALASALRSNPSHLKHLDLSGNEMGVFGVKQLSDLLQDPLCELKILRLCKCGVTDEGCVALASALRSNPSYLRELNLSGNKLRASGLNLLSDGLKDSHCKLETLWLSYCGVTDEGCADLASALRSNPSHLRELNLSGNKLGASGLNLISDLLKDPHCKLEKLGLKSVIVPYRLRWCGITDEGFVALASVLRSISSHLRELNLTGSNLQASGINLLSAGLKDPHCKLETLCVLFCQAFIHKTKQLFQCINTSVCLLKSVIVLYRLSYCGVTDEGCAALASALRSNPSQLRELDLTRNDVGDSGVKLLSDGLKDPRCKLERLCGIKQLERSKTIFNRTPTGFV